MSKSYISTLSLIFSVIITAVTLLSVPNALEALADLSERGFILKLLKPLSSILEVIVTASPYFVLFTIILKCLNVTFCKKFTGAIVLVFDILVLPVCILFFMLNVSILSWVAVMAAIFVWLFNFVYFYAQM